LSALVLLLFWPGFLPNISCWSLVEWFRWLVVRIQHSSVVGWDLSASLLVGGCSQMICVLRCILVLTSGRLHRQCHHLTILPVRELVSVRYTPYCCQTVPLTLEFVGRRVVLGRYFLPRCFAGRRL